MPAHVSQEVLPTPVTPIVWGEDGKFDRAYDHRWVRTEWSRKCRDCGMPYNRWDGYPCSAKAEQVWIPRRGT